jgi:hypothetical protein
MGDDSAVRDLIERDRIAQVVNTLFVATDARDWERVKGCFAPVVMFDMTTVAGGTEQELTPDAIASAWRSGLEPIEAVHHQTGNLVVTCTGPEATASCYGIAYHYRKTAMGRNTRVFVGSYDLHLVLAAGQWRIDRFRFNLKFLDGNPALEAEPVG